MILTVLVISCVLIVYHHFLYPKLLKLWLGKCRGRSLPQSEQPHSLPKIGVFISAYNEADFVAEKLNNIACQVYPNDHIHVHLVTDGCTDNTASIARKTAEALDAQNLQCSVEEFTHNNGKVAVLNRLITKHRDEYDVIVFTDVSALLSVNTFKEIAAEMTNRNIVAVSGTYLPKPDGHHALEQYWEYQNAIRELEGHIGSVNGFAGAMFAIRASAVEPLAKDTINDDFAQVVQAISEHQLASFNSNIAIIECDKDDGSKDMLRRLRLAAGNWQQLRYIIAGFKHFSPSQKFSFISNKFLRGIMPLIFIITYSCAIVMALKGNLLFIAGGIALGAVHLLGVIKLCCQIKSYWPVIDPINYLSLSHLCGFVGIAMSLREKKAWGRVSSFQFKILAIKFFKRVFDVVAAVIGLIITLPIMLIGGLAVRLESRGPVLYCQLRVGVITREKAELIYVYKLRTMVTDAEKLTGPVWASGKDNRITRVGRFLRKTRIDELPQLWNVLMGDMSLIGPRPERPVFYQKLEQNIPYFTQRTYEVRPGITGLAQVMSGYDNSIEDVKQKIAWDYAYVLSMSSFIGWFKMEYDIVLKTIRVVLMGAGQ